MAMLCILPMLADQSFAASTGRGGVGTGGNGAGTGSTGGATGTAGAGAGAGSTNGSRGNGGGRDIPVILPVGGPDPLDGTILVRRVRRPRPIVDVPNGGGDTFPMRPHPPRRIAPRHGVVPVGEPATVVTGPPPVARRVIGSPVARSAVRPPEPPARAARGPSRRPVAVTPRPVPQEILVVLRPGSPADSAADLARRHGLVLVSVQTFTLVPATVERFSIRGNRSIAAVVRALAAEPRVLSAQANHAFALSDAGEAPDLEKAQYAIAKLHLDQAHRLATGRGVLVAVIDSTADAAHPALAGAIVDGTDLLGAGVDGTADRHGTAIVGLIAARARLASSAPEARIFAIRAFAEAAGAAPGSSGTTMDVLRGLDWAAAHKARVVNMSFAGPEDALLTRFLAAGAADGEIYVAAAGNAGPQSPPLYPAADPHVIAVTATDAKDRLFPAATRGAYIAIAAPGAEVFVALPHGGYGYSSGTSMAAAEISGIVALMLEMKPDLTPDAVRAALTTHATALSPADAQSSGGAGLADADRVLTSLAAPAAAVTARP